MRIVTVRGCKLSMWPSFVVEGLYIVYSRNLRESEKGVWGPNVIVKPV